MKLHFIRLLSFVLAITAISAVTVGCKNEQFDYVETTVPVTQAPVPWSNAHEFTYTPSEDGTDDILNINRSKYCFSTEGSLYFQKLGMMVRYDPETGRQTYLCTDPLCEHGEGCPFGRSDLTSGVYVYKDKVLYYGLDPDAGGMSVMLYSTTERTTKALRAITGNRMISTLVAAEEWYYFVDLVYNKRKDSYTRSLCRQFYDSGEIEVILTEDESLQKTYLVGTNGEVLYLSRSDDTFLVLSMDGKEVISSFPMKCDSLLSIYRDEYMIYMDGDTKELYQINMDGTGLRSLGIKDIIYFYLTDSYIYYITLDKVVSERDYNDFDNPDDDVDIYLRYCSIYRCDHDGKNSELIYQNVQGDDILQFERFNPFIAEGNYLYGIFTYQDVKGEDIIATDSRQTNAYTYFRIDCTTGEVYYIDVE